MAAVLLAVAILVEVASTAALPRTHGFTDPVWSAAVVAGYAETCLLEVKYAGEPPHWLHRALGDLGKPERLSKYAMGMHALETAAIGG